MQDTASHGSHRPKSRAEVCLPILVNSVLAVSEAETLGRLELTGCLSHMFQSRFFKDARSHCALNYLAPLDQACMLLFKAVLHPL